MKDEITIRTYRDTDLPALVDLTNASDATDKLERATTLEAMQTEMTWPGYLPETDAFLAWAGDRLVGWSDIFLRKGESGAESIFYGGGLTHPAWRRRGVGRRLLERSYQRAVQRLPEAPAGPVYFNLQARDVEAGRRALHESCGFQAVRYFVNMDRPLDDGLPPLQVPPGYRLHRFSLERDLQAMWRVDTDSFADHWGFTGFPFDEFRHMLELPGFRPELSWLAEEEATGAAVGMALNRIDPDWIATTGRQEGMVNTLGVLREHRRNGLGAALLVQSIHTLRQAGMHRAHLWADSENLTGAVRLYERAGFQVRKTAISYRRTMRSSLPPAAAGGTEGGCILEPYKET